MSTYNYNDKTQPGLRSRLWRGLRSIVNRRRLFASEPSRPLSHRYILRSCFLFHMPTILSRRKENGHPPEMQPTTSTTTTTTTIQMPGTTLFADDHDDDGKLNPSEWFPIYQSCIEHFVNVAQHRPLAQSLAAHINILLPCQRATDGILNLSESSQPTTTHNGTQQREIFSLIPYIRRLVVTATDTPTIMQELFGANWLQGVGSILSQERINYLFAAKSGGWLKTKAQYDILPYETVPFLKPLRDPHEEELRAAEARWSEWLAMEDWMVGPRSPFEDLSGN